MGNNLVEGDRGWELGEGNRGHGARGRREKGGWEAGFLRCWELGEIEKILQHCLASCN